MSTLALEPLKPLFDEGYNMYSVMMVVGTVPESGEGTSMIPELKVAKTMLHACTINPACFHVGLMAAQGRAAVGHQADARPHHTSRSAHLRQQQNGDAAGSVE
ncbi:hypothetical protein [Halomonas cupida]|uniref:hypothetical protein n=1 Tax=Halomonas cupida TaxID=44933 RepID=UPI003A92A445